MPGAYHDELNDIDQIRDNLRDRYKSGFPVLKEIIQNADDAGATHLTMGWTDGLPMADHPLLSEPALFFINNAPLRDKDAIAIRSIAMGAKADSKTAVGKFGLGMKSLFHFGELYFFLANDWRIDSVKAEVFNPWGDSYRPQWDRFTDSDKEAIEHHLSDMLAQLAGDASLVVWVPIRSISKLDGIEPIVKSNDYQTSVPDFLIDPMLQNQVARLIPLLKHLNQIDLYLITGGNPQSSFSVAMTPESGRIAYGRDSDQPVWGGQIQIANSRSAETDSIHFAGTEVLLTDQPFSDLRNHPKWPSSFGRGAEGSQKERVIEDKTDAHAASVLLRKKTDSQAMLSIQWAVFLPLGEQDTQEQNQRWTMEIEGGFDYELLLHGYFFVDAGRVGIHGRHHLGKSTSLEISDDTDLTMEWNRNLANLGTFDTVIQTLTALVEELRLSRPEIHTISSGIEAFLSENKSFSHWVTRSRQWIFGIEEEHRGWREFDSNNPVRTIPKPDSEDYGRIWATFPSFSNLATKYVLAEHGQPNLVSEQNRDWSQSEIEALLEADFGQLSQSRKQLSYFNQFFQLVLDLEPTLRSPLQPAFINASKKLLKEIPLTELSTHKQQFQKFFSFVFPGKRCSLQVDRVSQKIWHKVGSTASELLLIPEFLYPEDSSVSGKLTLEDARRILEALTLDTGNDASTSTLEVRTTDKLVNEVLGKLSKLDRNFVYGTCSHLRLFRARVFSESSETLLSKDDLFGLKNKHCLFQYSGAGNFGLGGELSQALKNPKLVYVPENVSKLLFDSQVPKCDESAVLKVLENHPSLKDPVFRVTLLHKLAAVDVSEQYQLTGMRYLLHAYKDDNCESPLWIHSDEASPIWGRIWKQSFSEGGQEWSVIPEELARELTGNHQKKLNICSIDPNEVLEKLSNRIMDLDFSSLIRDQRDAEEVLVRIDDPQTWKSLPLHFSTNGAWQAITESCVLQSDGELPNELEQGIVRICHASNPDVHSKQLELIGELNDCKKVWVALQQDRPHLHNVFILEQLSLLKAVPEDLSNQLSTTKWIIADGQTISPKQVINLTSQEHPESIALCAHKATNCYAPNQLKGAGDLVGLISPYMTKAADAPGLLFDSARMIAGYAVGRCQPISVNALEQACTNIDLFHSHPGWRLIAECFSHTPESTLEHIEMLCCETEKTDNLSKIYERLIGSSSNLSSIDEIRRTLLQAISHGPKAATRIQHLKLKTANNQLRKASSLTYDMPGISQKALLHKTDWEIIRDGLDLEQKDHQPSEKPTEKSSGRVISADVLRQYFHGWNNHVPEDCIAALLSLMSGCQEIKELAQSLFSVRSLDSVLGTIAKGWTVQRDYPGRAVFFPEKTLQQVVSEMNFHVSACSGKNMSVPSIFGDPITVELDESPSTIFVWDRRQFDHANSVRVFLAPIDPARMGPEQLVDTLKRSAELLLKEIYRQQIDLGSLWASLSKVEQLHVAVAKKMILERLVPILRTLKVKQPPIGDLLNALHSEELKDVEADFSNQSRHSKKFDILRKISHAVESDTELQKKLLESMRNKIEEFQYQQPSVPFEIFQNADDAVSERINMEGSDALSSTALRRVEVHEDKQNNALDFYHWGRNINQYKSLDGSFDGTEDGYDRDLENMLVLNISDKGEGRTGKFGLGFKSAFLISDTPEIHSDRIAVRIEGGMLPVPSPDSEKLSLLVDKNKKAGRAPTLIHLPLRQGVSSSNVLAEFRSSVGVLCVFSKHIDTIQVCETEVHWTPRKCSRIEGLSFGHAMLPLADGSLRAQRIAHYRSTNGQFLFQLDGNGFTSLKNRELPKFWVLNPLKETIPLGFAIEGDFQVDVGRSQLARNPVENEALMGQLGSDLHSLLRQLDLWIKEDWTSFQNELELDSEASLQRFWSSVWHVLTDGWLSRLGEEPASGGRDSRVELVKHLFTAKGALIDFYDEAMVLPVGLKKTSSPLISLASVKYWADPLLTNAFASVRDLPVLKQIISDDAIVSDSIGRFLRYMGLAEKRKLSSKSIGLLLQEHLPDQQVMPHAASDLGLTFTPELIKELSDKKATLAEVDQLKSALSSFKFKAVNGSWYKSDLLLDEKTTDSEESLRAAFAPDSAKLSSQYDSVGRSFYHYCRSRSRVRLDSMLGWTKEVERDELRQKSLLRYLVAGELGKAFAENLKGLRNSGHWLYRIDAQVLKKWGWNDHDIDLLLNFHFATALEVTRRVKGNKDQDWLPQVAAPEALSNIADWWDSEGKTLSHNYDLQLYPGGVFDWEAITEDDLTSLKSRKAWLQLLYLGSCQTIGRTNATQHRNAMQWFEHNKWWDVFASPQPLQPERWLKVLDDYLDQAATGDNYRLWLQILPIYRFTRHLDDYVELFWSAERFLENLDDLMRPGSSTALKGTGISVPELKATLGIGINFVIRELIRNQVMNPGALTPFGFSASKSVRHLMIKLGCDINPDDADYAASKAIYEYIASELGDDSATFNGSYDIPLRIIAEKGNESLRKRLLGVGEIDIYDGEELHYGNE